MCGWPRGKWEWVVVRDRVREDCAEEGGPHQWSKQLAQPRESCMHMCQSCNNGGPSKAKAVMVVSRKLARADRSRACHKNEKL